MHADVSGVAVAERERRELLRFPPCSAMAEISGRGRGCVRGGPGHASGVEVVETSEGRWWVRAPDHPTLCDALAGVSRPSGRLRIEVDPLRI